MGISLLKWKFQKINDMFYITSNIHNNIVYISSTFTDLKPNSKVKCDQPIRLVTLTHTIPPKSVSVFDPNKWDITDNTPHKHTFYIRQKLDGKYIYLSVCNKLGTLMMTYSSYEWNLINLDKLHQFKIHESEEYIIVDFKSTNALNIVDNKLSLAPTYFWRLSGIPFKKIKEPFSLNNLFQSSKNFYIYSNIDNKYNDTRGNIYLSAEGYTTANSTKGYTLTGIVVDDIECEGANRSLYMCNPNILTQKGLQSLQWNLTSNSITNIFNKTFANLTYLSQGNIFYTISKTNTDWIITNLIRTSSYRQHDLIIIDSKLSSPNKTLIIDPSTKYNATYKSYTGFKLIQTEQLDRIQTTNIMESCMNTNALDLYIGKYNFTNKAVNNLQKQMQSAKSTIDDNTQDINKKTIQLNTLRQNIGEQIEEAKKTHHSADDIAKLETKLNTNSKQITDDITELQNKMKSSNANIKALTSELNNVTTQRDKWKNIIDEYDTECDKLYNNSETENIKISKYINSMIGNSDTTTGGVEYFTTEDNTLQQAQIDSQLNIIQEKKNLIDIRTSMLREIQRTNKVKRNLIYISASCILLISVIIAMLYVRNNKKYIIKPEM